MKFKRLARRLALITVVGASALSTSACGEEAPPESAQETVLVTIPDDTVDAMFGRVSGTLSVNDKGCFAVDNRVLVVGKGSQVLEGGDSINIADVGVVKVGSRASGSGGYIDGAAEVEHFAKSLNLGDAARRCQLDAGDPSLAVMDPATSTE